MLGQTVAKSNHISWENVQSDLRLSWDHVRSNGPNIKPHFLRECLGQCWDYAKTITDRSNGGRIVPTSAQRMFGECWWTMLRSCPVKRSQHCFHLCWAKVQIMLRPLISNRSNRDNIDSVFSPEICWRNVAWEQALRFVGKGTNGKEKYGSEEMGEWPPPVPLLRSSLCSLRSPFFFPFYPTEEPGPKLIEFCVTWSLCQGQRSVRKFALSCQKLMVILYVIFGAPFSFQVKREIPTYVSRPLLVLWSIRRSWTVQV